MFKKIVTFLSLIRIIKKNIKTDGRNEYSKETAKLLVKGYAEMKKQEYLNEYKDDKPQFKEYYKERGEEIKNTVLNNPEMFLRMPSI